MLALLPSCKFIRVAKQSTRHFHLKCTRDATTLIRFEWVFRKFLASGCVSECECLFVYGVPYRDFHMCLEISVLPSVPILYSLFSLSSARFSFVARSSVDQHRLYKYTVQIRKQTWFLLHAEDIYARVFVYAVSILLFRANISVRLQ